MSQQITEAFVQQYSANVFHLSQQQGSRFRPRVRNESQVGKTAYYDRIGLVTAQLKTGRHSSTPQLDTPHSRRAVSLSDYEWADLVDDEDKIRLLNDPTSEYAIAAMWSMGRAMDSVVIAAATGTAYTGEAGATSTVLPVTQKIGAVASTAQSDLNVATLRKVKRIMDAAEVDPSLKRYMAVTAKQIEALLGQTEVTSSDYNTVKALAQGDINTFLGFEFIHSERLALQTTATLAINTTTGVISAGSSMTGTIRKCFAWAENGLLLSIGADMKAKIGERADKSYAMQVYACMSLGAVRMEEEKVVEVLCTEA